MDPTGILLPVWNKLRRGTLCRTPGKVKAKHEMIHICILVYRIEHILTDLDLQVDSDSDIYLSMGLKFEN